LRIAALKPEAPGFVDYPCMRRAVVLATILCAACCVLATAQVCPPGYAWNGTSCAQAGGGGGGGGGGAGDLNQGGNVNAGNNVVAGANGVSVGTATVTGGTITFTGSGTCTFTMAAPTGGTAATFTATVTSGVAQAPYPALAILSGGTGYKTNPTSATVSGACSGGPATLTTTLTPGCVHLYEGSAAGNDLPVCAPNTYPISQTFTLPFSPFYGTPAALITAATYGPPPANVNYIRCNATSNNVVVTLPPLTGSYRYITMKRMDANFATGGFTCSFAPSSGDSISDSASSTVLTQANTTVTLVDIPTGPTAYSWHRPNSTNASSQLIAYCQGNMLAAAGTYYLAPGATATTNCASLSAGGFGFPMSTACTARALVAAAAQHNLGNTVTYTLMKNEIATALTCQMAAGATTGCADNTDLVSFSATDRWSITVQPGASDTTQNPRVSFQCQ
jgi:hypothetical protein